MVHMYGNIIIVCYFEFQMNSHVYVGNNFVVTRQEYLILLFLVAFTSVLEHY
jgi:hypothetical protein